MSLNTKVEILLTEYKTVREEILQKMGACWKILTFETGGTSAVLGFVFVNKEYRLLLIIPYLILICSFLHLSETLTIMNAGNYIKNNLEVDLKKFLGEKGCRSVSWENFVKEKSKPYKFVHISTASLFIGMCWTSIILSMWFKEKIGILPPYDGLFYLLLLAYFVSSIGYLYLWGRNILLDCDSKEKQRFRN